MLSKLPRKYIRNRDDYILKACKDKKVLHTGASDWPFTKEKFTDGSLLYSRLGDVVSEQLGIDLDKESTDFLNNQYVPNSKIIIKDLNQAQELDFKPEVIIFGETLEHLMNLEVVLNNLKEVMNKKTQLIISVPNSFYMSNFIYAAIGKESQHPDHSSAFTYKTLMTLMSKNNLEVADFYFTFLPNVFDFKRYNMVGKFKRSLKYLLVPIFPALSAGLLVSVKKRG